MRFSTSSRSCFEHVHQVVGQLGEELERAAVARMFEREARRVQERTIELLDGAQLRHDAPVDAAIHRVADDRMADAELRCTRI